MEGSKTAGVKRQVYKYKQLYSQVLLSYNSITLVCIDDKTAVSSVKKSLSSSASVMGRKCWGHIYKSQFPLTRKNLQRNLLDAPSVYGRHYNRATFGRLLCSSSISAMPHHLLAVKSKKRGINGVLLLLYAPTRAG